jgi:hypothetical protein
MAAAGARFAESPRAAEEKAERGLWRKQNEGGGELIAGAKK